MDYIDFDVKNIFSKVNKYMQAASYVSKRMKAERMSCRFWVTGAGVKYKIEAILQHTASSAVNDNLITIDDLKPNDIYRVMIVIDNEANTNYEHPLHVYRDRKDTFEKHKYVEYQIDGLIYNYKSWNEHPKVLAYRKRKTIELLRNAQAR